MKIMKILVDFVDKVEGSMRDIRTLVDTISESAQQDLGGEKKVAETPASNKGG